MSDNRKRKLNEYAPKDEKGNMKKFKGFVDPTKKVKNQEEKKTDFLMPPGLFSLEYDCLEKNDQDTNTNYYAKTLKTCLEKISLPAHTGFFLFQALVASLNMIPDNVNVPISGIGNIFTPENVMNAAAVNTIFQLLNIGVQASTPLIRYYYSRKKKVDYSKYYKELFEKYWYKNKATPIRLPTVANKQQFFEYFHLKEAIDLDKYINIPVHLLTAFDTHVMRIYSETDKDGQVIYSTSINEVTTIPLTWESLIIKDIGGAPDDFGFILYILYSSKPDDPLWLKFIANIAVCLLRNIYYGSEADDGIDIDIWNRCKNSIHVTVFAFSLIDPQYELFIENIYEQMVGDEEPCKKSQIINYTKLEVISREDKQIKKRMKIDLENSLDQIKKYLDMKTRSQ